MAVCESIGALRHLIVRNYEPPKTPLYTADASQVPLMDLFGVAGCSQVRGQAAWGTDAA